VELAAVGQAITNLMLTSSIVADYLEFLHRVNIFAFKPCEYCTPSDATFKEEKLLNYDEIVDLYMK